MTAALTLSGNNCSIINVSTLGGDCGIDVSGSQDLRMSNVVCYETKTAVRGSNVKRFSAEHVVHDNMKEPILSQQDVFRPTAIGYCVRMAIHGYV